MQNECRIYPIEKYQNTSNFDKSPKVEILTSMNNEFVTEVLQQMLPYMDNMELSVLKKVLSVTLQKYEVIDTKRNKRDEISNTDFIKLFLSAKGMEGCSTKTLKYYEMEITYMAKTINKEIRHITTDDLRSFLITFHDERSASRVTIDNIRRILSSFFSWLENEDYIIKSPMRRIHRVKTSKKIKEIYTDEMLEILRDKCPTVRDLAMIDLLISTGMRVGELVLLNREDINFEDRECIVFGKGGKERIVYFDARAKLHLEDYLQQRTDKNPALFVSLKEPHERLNISGVEIRLREIGKKLGIATRVHPHKFRRTLATMAIDKGMPIEQVQRLLGHEKIDTTLQYAMVKQSNVKLAHKKYIG